MKKLLIVVDYQNDFVTGSLGFPKAVKLEDAIVQKILQYREAGDEILFTLDTHGENYAQTQEGKCLPVPHCIEGTEGWNLYGKVAILKQGSDVCFCKPTFGCAELLSYLQVQEKAGKKYASIELVGLVSNICVLSNAVIAKTALPQVPVIVDAACTAAADEALHRAALQVLEGIQVQVINKEA